MGPPSKPLDVTPGAFPADPWLLLRNSRAMSDAIAAVTASPPWDVRGRLWHEFLHRGGSVRRAARELGVTRYQFNDAMIQLYSKSDAFLYELAIWNINLLKRSARSWITNWITKVLGPQRTLLTWGDGLGFDSLALAQAGHAVTCFDLPGALSTFAGRMIGASNATVQMVTNATGLSDGAFDAVVCLDVLEHVPDVPGELERIRRCLKPGGVLVVHAPFYFIHRNAVTHLGSNRRYSGSLALFRRAGFTLIDAQPTWAPLILARDDGERPRRPLLAYARLALALPAGPILAIGRLTGLPFEVINLVTRMAQPWYVDDMLRRGGCRTAVAEQREA